MLCVRKFCSFRHYTSGVERVAPEKKVIYVNSRLSVLGAVAFWQIIKVNGFKLAPSLPDKWFEAL